MTRGLPDTISAECRRLNPALFVGLPTPYELPADAPPGKADADQERELQRLCELELSRRGIWFLHLSPRAREKIGCPDLLFALNGVPHAIELKSKTGRLSDEQKTALEQMAANGWRTAVVRGYGQFVEVLET